MKYCYVSMLSTMRPVAMELWWVFGEQDLIKLLSWKISQMLSKIVHEEIIWSEKFVECAHNWKKEEPKKSMTELLIKDVISFFCHQLELWLWLFFFNFDFYSDAIVAVMISAFDDLFQLAFFLAMLFLFLLWLLLIIFSPTVLHCTGIFSVAFSRSFLIKAASVEVEDFAAVVNDVTLLSLLFMRLSWLKPFHPGPVGSSLIRRVRRRWTNRTFGCETK